MFLAHVQQTEADHHGLRHGPQTETNRFRERPFFYTFQETNDATHVGDLSERLCNVAETTKYSSHSATIGLLLAIGSGVVRLAATIWPTQWSYPVISWLAFGITQGAILLLAGCAP